ncbi:MAG: ribosome maturation factor RimP [Cyanobacteria bacterium P01_D01_bin.123]
MTHPLAVEVERLARPIAQSLGLDVVRVVFHTNQRPPVMRVDIHRPDADNETSHADCEALSRALDARLDEADVVPGNYLLEVSSPGVSAHLRSDRDFAAFKGFAVTVTVEPPHKGRTQWIGTLQGRDDKAVTLSCKGRKVTLPREIVRDVELQDGEAE